MFSNRKVSKPELFQLIEKNDELLSLLLQREAIPFKHTGDVLKRKRELIQGAEKFVQRQRESK